MLKTLPIQTIQIETVDLIHQGQINVLCHVAINLCVKSLSDLIGYLLIEAVIYVTIRFVQAVQIINRRTGSKQTIVSILPYCCNRQAFNMGVANLIDTG